MSAHRAKATPMSGELEQKDQDLWTGKECAHAATAWRCAGNEDGATWPKTSNSRSRSRNARWMKKHADRRRPTRPEACTRNAAQGGAAPAAPTSPEEQRRQNKNVVSPKRSGLSTGSKRPFPREETATETREAEPENKSRNRRYGGLGGGRRVPYQTHLITLSTFWAHVDYAVHVSSWQPGGNPASCMGLASGQGPGDSLRRSCGLVLPKSPTVHTRVEAEYP